jgi:hypothetical protein
MANTNSTAKVPGNWTVSIAGNTTELRHSMRGWNRETLFGVTAISTSGYLIFSILSECIIVGRPAKIGDFGFCLAAVCGLGFGAYLLDHVFFGRTSYTLSPNTLDAAITSLFRNSIATIDRSSVINITQLHLPSHSLFVPDTWQTIILYRSSRDDEQRRFIFDGCDQAETQWLAERLAEWADVEWIRC